MEKKGDWSSFQEEKTSGKMCGSSSSSWEFQMEFGMEFWDAVSFLMAMFG